MAHADAPSVGQAAPVWHTTGVAEVAALLETDQHTGLTRAEADRRLARDGPNDLPERGGRRLWDLIVEQFKDVMILLLLAAAVVSGAIGDVIDTIAILVIIVLNATIGVFQGYRAEQAIEALRAMAAPQARVIRDGDPMLIPSARASWSVTWSCSRPAGWCRPTCG